MASTIIRKQYTTEAVRSESLKLAGNTYGSVTIDVSKSGYTPIGVIGSRNTGASSGYAAPSHFQFSGNNLTVGLVNTRSSSLTITVVVTVLYERSPA